MATQHWEFVGDLDNIAGGLERSGSIIQNANRRTCHGRAQDVGEMVHGPGNKGPDIQIQGCIGAARHAPWSSAFRTQAGCVRAYMRAY
eukprot:6445868-Pyramimonas_sp.AAC.1